MAYCVHCGVKLHDAESTCPLCGTQAVDPSQPAKADVQKPFPVRTPEQTLRVNRKYAVSLLSVLLLLPAGVCLLLDLFSGRITWSIYPSGVLVLSWIAVTVPLLMRRHRLYSTILITGGTLAGYLYMVERLSNAPGWFLPVVFPCLVVFVLMICFTVWLTRSIKARKLLIVAAALVEVGLLSLLTELLCARIGAGTAFSWSQFVMAPCFFSALLMYIITKNRPLYEELRRRLHF